MFSLDKLTDLAHNFMAAHIKAGDRVIDATAGNGHDTLFLAGVVGPSGLVYAFDIQKTALRETAARLKDFGFSDRVVLLQKGHETLSEYAEPPVSAVMYNLGYLPGGDKEITTSAESSLTSIKEALKILSPGGMLSIIAYSGHESGKKERDALMAYCSALDPHKFKAVQLTILNRKNEPPELLLLQKSYF